MTGSVWGISARSQTKLRNYKGFKLSIRVNEKMKLKGIDARASEASRNAQNPTPQETQIVPNISTRHLNKTKTLPRRRTETTKVASQALHLPGHNRTVPRVSSSASWPTGLKTASASDLKYVLTTIPEENLNNNLRTSNTKVAPPTLNLPEYSETVLRSNSSASWPTNPETASASDLEDALIVIIKEEYAKTLRKRLEIGISEKNISSVKAPAPWRNIFTLFEKYKCKKGIDSVELDRAHININLEKLFPLFVDEIANFGFFDEVKQIYMATFSIETLRQKVKDFQTPLWHVTSRFWHELVRGILIYRRGIMPDVFMQGIYAENRIRLINLKEEIGPIANASDEDIIHGLEHVASYFDAADVDKIEEYLRSETGRKEVEESIRVRDKIAKLSRNIDKQSATAIDKALIRYHLQGF